MKTRTTKHKVWTIIHTLEQEHKRAAFVRVIRAQNHLIRTINAANRDETCRALAILNRAFDRINQQEGI